MNTITTTVFAKVATYCRERYFKITHTGTQGIDDSELVKRIVLVNRLSLAIAAIMLVIAPIVCIFLIWKVSILMAFIIEFAINCSVLLLNHHKKHLAASLTLYYNQCVAIIFFGFLLGGVLQLQFTIVFLISIIYLILKEYHLRKICFIAAITTLVVLQLCYYFQAHQPLVTITYDTGFVIQSLVIGGVLILMIIISKTYVRSNDTNQELEKTNHFKKMFVYQVTHEMRTPLNAIYGVAQLLKREIKLDANLKPIESLTNQLLAASNTTRNIINNVLDMAEIETGKLESSMEGAFPVRPFFEKMIDVNKIVARSRSIQLKLFMDQMPEILIGDTLKLNQIVTNLLANAIKFADKNTIILLKVTGLEEGLWRIQVINQGATISPQRINVIFDPFITLKPKSMEGTGLGLYIVKNKVSSMQGTIAIESLGEGLTTFTVTLPLRAGKREDVPAEEMEDDIKDLSNIHVMIAEDDEMNALLLSSFLRHIGCKVTYTANGLELLQKVEKEIPDVIILDSYMPVMNGEETLQYLRNVPEFRSIPVIVATGDAFKDSREAFITAGASAFIEKPIDHKALLKALRIQLHHNNEELQE
ncbi:hybrid sensor histidine kinase/response regulator [Chitinophaga defluvii]|uniref:histidine kinase n=1 Tax=Chitinophaga defluvii TaxID=3163343 RepID=A0ABV2TC38_9BACT